MKKEKRPFSIARSGKLFMLTAVFMLYIVLSSMPVMGEEASETFAANMKQSVVRIVCETSDGKMYGGSGFAIGKNEPIRYVVTNWHVVANNPQGVAVWRSRDYFIKAEVKISLPLTDLAVLELESELYKVPPVTFGSCAETKEGHRVYAFGFPGASDILTNTTTGNPEDVSLTDGIVSAVKLSNINDGAEPVHIYQHSADVNPGNSGGPLTNDQGQVIGINTWGIKGASGVYGAIQADELLKILDQRGIGYNKASEGTSILKGLTNSSDKKDGETSKSGEVSQPTPAATPTAAPAATSTPAPVPAKDNKLMMTLIIVAGAVLLLAGIIILVLLLNKNKKNSSTQSAAKATTSKPTVAPQVTVQQPKQAVLRGLSGYFSGNTITVGRESIALGRDPKTCQLVFPQDITDISRKHSVIRLDETSGSFILEDCSSSNGTYLASGEKLLPGKAYYLKSGDRFYLSDSNNMFEVRWER